MQDGQDPRLRRALARSARLSSARLRKILPRAAKGPDPDAIHDVRVATRRLREALALFRPILDRKPASRLRKRTRSLTRGLGEARNLDVAGEYFEALKDDRRAGAQARAAASEIAVWLARKRRTTQKRVDTALASFPGKALGRDVRALLDGAAPARSAPRSPHAAAVRDAGAVFAIAELADRWRRVAEARAVAIARPEAAAVHALRIAVKKYRYALEILAPEFARGGETLVEEARGWQTNLGRIHDLDVFLDMARARLDGRLARPLAAAIDKERRALYAEFLKGLGSLDAPEQLRSLIAAFPPAAGRSPARRRRRGPAPARSAQ